MIVQNEMEKSLYQKILLVSNAERRCFGNDRVPPHVERLMREHMAAFISDERIEVKEREFSTEYRLQLYVLSPDVLYGLIQREALEQMKWLSRAPLCDKIEYGLGYKGVEVSYPGYQRRPTPEWAIPDEVEEPVEADCVLLFVNGAKHSLAHQLRGDRRLRGGDTISLNTYEVSGS